MSNTDFKCYQCGCTEEPVVDLAFICSAAPISYGVYCKGFGSYSPDGYCGNSLQETFLSKETASSLGIFIFKDRNLENAMLQKRMSVWGEYK